MSEEKRITSKALADEKRKRKPCSCKNDIEELKDRIRKLEQHINMTSGIYRASGGAG